MGHAHQGVGQGDDRQEVLGADGPGHPVRPVTHDVRRGQSPACSLRQLTEQGLLGRGREGEKEEKKTEKREREGETETKRERERKIERERQGFFY